MKKITWITAGYMLQVDLPILAKLKQFFDIFWVVFASENSDARKTATEYAQKHDVNVMFFDLNKRWFDPRGYWGYKKIFKEISTYDSDIFYLNMVAFPYALWAIKKTLPFDKVVMAMHHGKIHKGMRLPRLYKFYLKHLCNLPYRFQYFSNSQAQFFSGKDVSRKCVIPLALNDYGCSEKKPDEMVVQFLSFGHIIDTKNIQLLINAACKLREITDKRFKVKIVGNCRLWNSLYKPLIKYPEIFDLDIRNVPDKLIPELFSTSHYLVLPYKSVTQSGPLRIAYGYNTPVIVSDLDGFKESVEDDVTGIFFKSEDLDSLVSVMERVLNGGMDYYEKLKERQLAYIQSHFSVDSIVSQYCDMFDGV